MVDEHGASSTPAVRSGRTGVSSPVQRRAPFDGLAEALAGRRARRLGFGRADVRLRNDAGLAACYVHVSRLHRLVGRVLARLAAVDLFEQRTLVAVDAEAIPDDGHLGRAVE